MQHLTEVKAKQLYQLHQQGTTRPLQRPCAMLPTIPSVQRKGTDSREVEKQNTNTAQES